MQAILDAFDFSSSKPLDNEGELSVRFRSEIDGASAQGDLLLLQELLDQRPDPEKLNFALSSALNCSEYDAVYALLAYQVPVEAHNIRRAVAENDLMKLDLLLDYSWNINRMLDWNEPPVLSLAIFDLKLLSHLLWKGADPNARCWLDWTPLSTAIELASLDIIRLLFERGGSVHSGQLLHHAIHRSAKDKVRVVTFLLDLGAPVNKLMYEDDETSTSLQSFCGLGSALHDAAAIGDAETVRVLLEYGADPEIRDRKGFTALRRAKKFGSTEVVSILSNFSR